MHKQKAFSLIELMVAIVIIGILSTTLAIGASKSKLQSRDAQRIGDILLIGKSIDLVSISNNAYPSVTKCLGQTPCPSNTIIGRIYDKEESPLSKIDLNSFPTKKIPKDPKPVIKFLKENPTSGELSNIINIENQHNIMSGYLYSKYENDNNNPNKHLETFYTLEVGLENGVQPDKQLQNSDDTNLKMAPTGIVDRFVHKKTINYSDAYAVGKGTRFRFIFTGTYCGNSCY